MNHIRTTRRSRLKAETLDALLRIRLNLPDSISYYNVLDYVEEWVKTHKLTDYGEHRGQKTVLEDNDGNVENENKENEENDENIASTRKFEESVIF